MAAEPASCRKRTLEIHPTLRAQIAQVGAGKRFLQEIESEESLADRRRREATAVYADALARFHPGGDDWRGDLQLRAATARRPYPAHLPHFLNQPGKH